MSYSNKGDDTVSSNVGLPGEPLEGPNKEKVLVKVRTLIGWNRNSFPGAQPVSFKRSDIYNLYLKDYVVCEKSDGVRALLLAASGGIYLTGRNDEVHYLPMKLPLRGNLVEAQHITLLDGEIVVDDIDDDGVRVQRTRFMCYDGLYVHGRKLASHNLMERLSIVYTDVIVPYRRALESKNKALMIKTDAVEGLDVFATNDDSEDEKEPVLEIFLKDFFDISQITFIEDFAKKLPHISDGLIFTPVDASYKGGTCPNLLKWKPPHLNTVDFSVDVVYDRNRCPRLLELHVMHYGTRMFYNEFMAPYGNVYKQIMEMAINSKVTQLIVECSWITDSRVWTFIPHVPSSMHNDSRPDSDLNDGKVYDFNRGTWVQGGWYAERIRYDKKLPNSVKVANNVKSSIEDDITFEMLMEELKRFARGTKIPVYKKCTMPRYYTAVPVD